MVYFFRPADAQLEEQPIADAKNMNYHLQLQHQQHQQQLRRQMSPSECDTDDTPTNHRRGSSSPMLFGIDAAMKNLMRPRAQSASPTWLAEEETKHVTKSNVVEFSASNNNDNHITVAQKRAMELSAMYELSEQQEEDLNPTATFAEKTKNKKYILPSIKMTGGGGGGGGTGVSTSMVSGLSAAKKAAQKFAKSQHRLAQTKKTTKATEVSTLSLDIGASPPPRKGSHTKKLSSDAPTSPLHRQHSRTLSSDSIGMYSAAIQSMEEGEGPRADIDHNDGRRDDNENQDQRDDVAPAKHTLSVSMRRLVIGVCKPIQNTKTSTREDLRNSGDTFHPGTNVPILYNLPSLC
jgi:hypothetical protein